MGVRGPLPKRRTASARTADGVRLRQLPEDADAIFKRLARDIAGLTPADVAIVEDTARWTAIAKAAYSQLRGDEKAPTGEQLEQQEVEMLLTVTDTAHGNKEESRKNPLLIVLRTASEQIRANVQQLGATPLARARMPEPEHKQMSLADILFADVGVTDE
jgi:phage terminase small subunit